MQGDEDLFDLSADPYEMKNLAGEIEHAERIAQLKTAAMAWWKETGGKPLHGG